MNAIRKGSGKQITIVAGSSIAAGDVVVANGLIGVAPYSIAAGATGVVDLEGDFELDFDGASASEQGVAAYYNSTTKKVTATSTDNTAIGHFAVATASGATRCRVILG